MGQILIDFTPEDGPRLERVPVRTFSYDETQGILTFVREVDGFSPLLFNAALTDRGYDTVVIRMVGDGGGATTLVLGDLYVSEYNRQNDGTDVFQLASYTS
jgi:hypothetical protein